MLIVDVLNDKISLFRVTVEELGHHGLGFAVEVDI
jgi:hypothetical protein